MIPLAAQRDPERVAPVAEVGERPESGPGGHAVGELVELREDHDHSQVRDRFLERPGPEGRHGEHSARVDDGDIGLAPRDAVDRGGCIARKEAELPTLPALLPEMNLHLPVMPVRTGHEIGRHLQHET